MKKHLYGKRYMIARRSVAIGRNNRRIYKLNRSIVLMKRIDWQKVASNMGRLLVKAAQSLVSDFQLLPWVIDRIKARDFSFIKPTHFTST